MSYFCEPRELVECHPSCRDCGSLLTVAPRRQVFNEFNARSIGNKLNMFSGLQHNPIFMGVILVTIGCQIFIVEIGGKFTTTTGLTLEHWGYSILMGFGSTPIGFLMRFIPIEESTRVFANYYGIGEEVSGAVPWW